VNRRLSQEQAHRSKDDERYRKQDKEVLMSAPCVSYRDCADLGSHLQGV
jgi:hypothetical protein